MLTNRFVEHIFHLGQLEWETLLQGWFRLNFSIYFIITGTGTCFCFKY
jgi:hypothetical protein